MTSRSRMDFINRLVDHTEKIWNIGDNTAEIDQWAGKWLEKNIGDADPLSRAFIVRVIGDWLVHLKALLLRRFDEEGARLMEDMRNEE
jgi:hypothetical protein